MVLPPFEDPAYDAARMSKIETQWHRFEALTADELYDMLRFRQSIFVVEQRSPYPDLDGLDQGAWHLLARLEGKLAGYLRLIPLTGPPLLVRIGRVAVSAYLRRHGIGRMLLEEALRLCSQQYRGLGISLGAQTHLVSFYQALGFEEIGEPYDDFGVPHIEMRMPRSS
jgi:ElaA protein